MTEENVTDSGKPAEEVKEIKQEEKNTEDEKVEETKGQRPWFQKRFDRFTAQNQALSRERDALTQTNTQLLEELSNLRAGKAEDGGKSNVSDAELDQLVTKKALQIAEIKSFNEKCNAVHDRGLEEFDDFGDSVKILTSMGVMTKDFLDTVTELDNGHKILHYLGQNPEEADRIQNLSPTKRALALAKLENKSEERETKSISKVPAPIKIIKGKTANTEAFGTKYYDGMPHNEYETWRNKSAKK